MAAEWIADGLKVLLGGTLGYGAKWLQAWVAAENREVQGCLDQLDALANQASVSFFAILNGAPDPMLGFKVATDRDDLGVKLKRALGATPGYPGVVDALALFAKTLGLADPYAGLASRPDQAGDMRDAQQALRQAIKKAAGAKLAWRFSRHEGATK